MVYGSETWSLNAQERRKVKLFEIMCLRSIWGVKRMGRLRNTLIRERYLCELSVLERIERIISKWFGHVEIMGRKDWLKRAYCANKRVTRGDGDHTEDGG